MIRLACVRCGSVHVVSKLIFICAACNTINAYDSSVVGFVRERLTHVCERLFSYSVPHWAGHHFGRIADVYEAATDTTSTTAGDIRHGDMHYSRPEDAMRSAWRRRA